MFALALRSVRSRSTAFLATALSMFLGAVIVMSFAALLDTRAGGGVSAADRYTFQVMAGVVGTVGLLVVAFTVVATTTLTVRQRGTEIALLRSVGATPAQVCRMVVGEASVLAAAAAVLAVPVSIGTGWALVRALASAGVVDDGVAYHYGGYAVGVGVVVTVLAGTLAAWLATRRTAGLRVAESLRQTALGLSRLSRRRAVIGWLFVVIGVNCAVVTANLLDPDDVATTQSVAGEGAVMAAIGFAVLSPALLRAVAAVAGGVLRRLPGFAGRLAVGNLRQRSGQLAGALMPIIVFTGLAISTLYVQAIDNSITAGAGTRGDKGTETINYVVVGVICVFAAVAVVNALIAATTYRRREFGQLRLAGGTPRQVLRLVAIEDTVLIVTGLLFGTVAGLLTVVPYSVARTGSMRPDATIGIYLGIVVLVVLLTLAASLGTVRRTIATPAVEAATT